MVVNDILKPRKEVVDSKINFQYALKAYKVNSHDEDRLESTPERFFETTYPSNAIRNMISVVNDKLIGEDHQGGIVLSGSYGSGKTHALVTIYNLFKHPELAEEWIKYHNIKFNTESLKSDNNVCMLSTSEIDPDYLWKPIFSTLGFSNLLEEVKRYPTISTIEKIIGKGKTAIFIDELERWYGSIDSEEDQELLEANKMFLQNLLEVASENENLFVFIGFLEENRDLKEIINRINPRKEDMASTGDREKIIIHRLFETTKEDVDTTKIASVINEYIDEYNKSDIYFENTEKYIELMIRHYPFHPQLIEVLDDIYDSASESQNVRGEMQVLADLVKNNYLDKDLFLISDLDVRPLQSIDYIITNRYTSDKAECQKLSCVSKLLNNTLLELPCVSFSIASVSLTWVTWLSSPSFSESVSFPISADIINDKIKSDISEIKDYILEQVIGNETGIIAKDLLEDCKKYRKYPFISNDHVFYNALKQLYNEKRVFIEGDNNKIYRNEFIISAEASTLSWRKNNSSS